MGSHPDTGRAAEGDPVQNNKKPSPSRWDSGHHLGLGSKERANPTCSIQAQVPRGSGTTETSWRVRTGFLVLTSIATVMQRTESPFLGLEPGI